MARLTAAERAALPDRAFAYIDAAGRRRLPIVDASHVRNALARFNQVDFDSDEAREQARIRLLRAAKKHRIVPVGFISNELRSERRRGAPDTAADVPTGFVTMLMTDIEGSTGLVQRLGDDYGDLLGDVHQVHRSEVERRGGFVVEARADEFFAAFEAPRLALEAGIAIQRSMASRTWQDDADVRVRMGIHAGYPTPRGSNYVGLAVHATARICDAAHGGQIVVSDDTKLALTGVTLDGVRFRSLGARHLRGISGELTLHQVVAPELARRFPPPRG